MILNIWHKNANGAIYLEATREVTVAMRRGERASKKNGDRLIRLPSRLCFSSPLLSSTPSTAFRGSEGKGCYQVLSQYSPFQFPAQWKASQPYSSWSYGRDYCRQILRWCAI